MSPYYHALSSAKKFGGDWMDYIHIHEWFDETKQYTGNWTHRALRHHAAGVQWAVEKFGHVVKCHDGKRIPVKMVAEQHIEEDCGFVPTVEQWLAALTNHPEEWMLKVRKKSVELIQTEDENPRSI